MAGVENVLNVVENVGAIVSKLVELSDLDVTKLKDEVMELDSVEREKVALEFKKVFDLPNENLEETIEKGFEFVLLAVEIAGKFLPKK